MDAVFGISLFSVEGSCLFTLLKRRRVQREKDPPQKEEKRGGLMVSPRGVEPLLPG
jgi:hypothetical protein